MCKEFKWEMQGHHFVAEVFVLPLDNYDVILGAQWLATFDEIKWNFKTLRMKFQWQNKTCVLTGDEDFNWEELKQKKMSRLLSRKPHLAAMQLLLPTGTDQFIQNMECTAIIQQPEKD